MKTMQAYLYSPDTVLRLDPATGQSQPVLTFATLDAIHRHLMVDLIPDDAVDFAIDSAFDAWMARRTGIPQDEPFTWYTHDDDALDPADMATPHVFYALRMIWNHSVPEIWRVGDYKKYSDVPRWSAAYRQRAIEELTRELVSRDDVRSDHRQQFHELVLKTITILTCGI